MQNIFEIGQCLRFRRRHWLVENILDKSLLPYRLEVACLDDDAQGQRQTIIPSCEVSPRCIDDDLWQTLGGNTPTDSLGYSAYLQSLQWNTATAADNKLYQAPFRAGIELSAYQLAPLSKALELPRVNLLIADDVGLGKTIEAGLVLREMTLRKRVDFFVVAAPPSMTLQWQEELASKFGFSCVIVDKEFLDTIRAERGFGINPWTSGSAYIISHKLLIDPTYTDGLHAILGSTRARSMFILDEAHHAAPSHGHSQAKSSKYAVDSQMTRAVRELAKAFEHRLFLTATPHNGHSNSFAALLEILDPQRFTRGIKIKPEELDAIMVRRLKSDLREMTDTPFPVRKVEKIKLANEIDTAVELQLAEDLLAYGELNGAGAGYGFVRLQQRLLSSVNAFGISLKDEYTKLPDGPAKIKASQMLALANGNAHKSDAKSRWLSSWIKENIGDKQTWNDTRLIVFTEFRDTLNWLRKQLLQDLEIDEDEGRIEEFTGGTSRNDRERIKAKFNADPKDSNLRILLCTDAAREGINLQHRCKDLVHFDLPWNPSRLEQRNGRIDRRLQPAKEITCRYFVYKNRQADRILDALVVKTERINQELGEIGLIISETLEQRLTQSGITQLNAQELHQDFQSGAYLEAERKLEELRLGPQKEKRRRKLKEELKQLDRRLEQSKKRKYVAPNALQKVIISALAKIGAPINKTDIKEQGGVETFAIDPEADGFAEADWTVLFDKLHTRPKDKKETDADFRENAPLKRFAFSPVKDGDRLDTNIEHLHLEHRLVRRLLAQYEAQGFRARLERTAVFKANVERPRVVLLARLTLYAKGANRLHSELIPISATVGKAGVTLLKDQGKTASQVVAELQRSIEIAEMPTDHDIETFCHRAASDAQELRRIAQEISAGKEVRIRTELKELGEKQAQSLKQLLEELHGTIETNLSGVQGAFDFSEKEQKQKQDDEAHWQRRLTELENEIATEPDNVRARHEISARRLEPVGLIYLLPEASS